MALSMRYHDESKHLPHLLSTVPQADGACVHVFRMRLFRLAAAKPDRFRTIAASSAPTWIPFACAISHGRTPAHILKREAKPEGSGLNVLHVRLAAVL